MLRPFRKALPDDKRRGNFIGRDIVPEFPTVAFKHQILRHANFLRDDQTGSHYNEPQSTPEDEKWYGRQNSVCSWRWSYWRRLRAPIRRRYRATPARHRTNAQTRSRIRTHLL